MTRKRLAGVTSAFLLISIISGSVVSAQTDAPTATSSPILKQKTQGHRGMQCESIINGKRSTDCGTALSVMKKIKKPKGKEPDWMIDINPDGTLTGH